MLKPLILGLLALGLGSCAVCYSPSACSSDPGPAYWAKAAKEVRK